MALPGITPSTARFTHLLFHPRERVVDWFARPGAVRRLTPGLLPMTPTSEAANLADGVTEFAMPAGLKWVARHDRDEYVAGHRFADYVDNQPFRRMLGWRHVHKFEDVRGPGEDHPAWWTNVVDEVTARVPGRSLEGVFAYRAAVLEGDFAAADRLGEALTPRTIAVTGATGTVGSALCALLSTSGHDVVKLSRESSSEPGTRTWDPEAPAADLLDGIDVLIHLAGAPIAGRFTDKHLATVRDSRVGPSRKLADLAVKAGVGAIVSASAVGFYGADRGTEVLDEDAPVGSGPLAEIVRDWEEAWDPARDAGIRVATIRTGLVQSGGGGLLPILAGITSTGLGGKLGDGGQWFPWIALDDLLDVYHRAALDTGLSGPINAVAPGGVDNAEYTRTLARVLRRPAAIPVPKVAPAVLLGGRGADELAFANQRAVPRALEAADHVFRFPDLEAALRHELLRRPRD
ncbi:TIGR01777 family oxidoreductase [uncultured Corynebacterium sp.]|uniref:TIGR01777 family oxidoreductase n=1 Tax=uncultured Corynebacterium sp. TaxID=159447 RepID=UPI0025EEB881|nr:TIGR01777 family oxidoreductase [uncultured Corynebacterium sp.]